MSATRPWRDRRIFDGGDVSYFISIFGDISQWREIYPWLHIHPRTVRHICIDTTLRKTFLWSTEDEKALIYTRSRDAVRLLRRDASKLASVERTATTYRHLRTFLVLVQFSQYTTARLTTNESCLPGRSRSPLTQSRLKKSFRHTMPHPTAILEIPAPLPPPILCDMHSRSSHHRRNSLAPTTLTTQPNPSITPQTEAFLPARHIAVRFRCQ